MNKNLSSKVLNMKFMHRAKEAEHRSKLEQEQKSAISKVQWKLVDTSEDLAGKSKAMAVIKGMRILYESQEEPAEASKGRESFQNFNKTLDSMDKEYELPSDGQPKYTKEEIKAMEDRYLKSNRLRIAAEETERLSPDMEIEDSVEELIRTSSGKSKRKAKGDDETSKEESPSGNYTRKQKKQKNTAKRE